MAGCLHPPNDNCDANDNPQRASICIGDEVNKFNMFGVEEVSNAFLCNNNFGAFSPPQLTPRATSVCVSEPTFRPADPDAVSISIATPLLALNNFETNAINVIHTNSFQSQSVQTIPPLKTQMISHIIGSGEQQNSTTSGAYRPQTQLKMFTSPALLPTSRSSDNSRTFISPPLSHEDHSNTTLVVQNNRNVHYADITEYLNLPQTIAAKKLDIPTSTLSKRWKEAVRKRKWPYRTICKLDKEIITLLHNVHQSHCQNISSASTSSSSSTLSSSSSSSSSLSPEVEHALSYLLQKRQEELRTVIIRL